MFQSTIEVYLYDDDDPTGRALCITHTLGCQDEGRTSARSDREQDALTGGGWYTVDQAAYVALLMEQEIALPVSETNKLDVNSAFHEDFWDEVLNSFTDESVEMLPRFREFHHGGNTTLTFLNSKPDDRDGHDSGNHEWLPMDREAATSVMFADSAEERPNNPTEELQLLVELSSDAGADYITVETYGFFNFAGRGRRRVAVPLESISSWDHLLRGAWSDFDSHQATIHRVDSQPKGEATLRLFFYKTILLGRGILSMTLEETRHHSDQGPLR